MDLKTVELEGQTYAVIQDGKPVYLDGNTELAMDVQGMHAKIGQLNSEAKKHREAKEAAEQRLHMFEGIEDPDQARTAMQKLASLNEKDLIEAGKVEEIKNNAIKATEEKYAPYMQQVEELQGQLRQEKIGGSFARSEFIKEKVAVPPDMVEAMFGRNFSLEGGKVIARDGNGNDIYSKANPGNPATFDEALEILISGYAGKDHILRGAGGQGGGGKPSNGGGAAKKEVTRAEFDAMGQHERSTKIKDGYKITD